MTEVNRFEHFDEAVMDNVGIVMGEVADNLVCLYSSFFFLSSQSGLND